MSTMMITACTNPPPTPEEGPSPEVTGVLTPDLVQTVLEDVPHRSVGEPPLMSLDPGIVPPTNRWYSGLVFGDAPQPVFPAPLSFAVTDAGFALGLPRVTATPDAIFGSAQSDITAVLAGAQGRPAVTSADSVGVTLTYAAADDQALAEVHLAQGWPVVGLTAAAEVTVTLSAPMTPDAEAWVANVEGMDYGIVVAGGDVDGAQVNLEECGTAQWFPIPEGATLARMAQALTSPVASVETTFEVSADAATTTLAYGTEPTVLAMPSARAEQAGLECLGTYPTINGEFSACVGEAVTWSVPRVAHTTALDLDGLTDDERDEITAALKQDVATNVDDPADTYFGGKWLYRQAILLDMAVSLGEDEIAADLLGTLQFGVRQWTEPDGCLERDARCYVYDPQVRGMVGLTASFGADEFNDPHFHHSYLLLTAAIVARHDPTIVEEVSPVLDLLAANLASAPGSEHFPAWRTFDPFTGHSWASGYAPFADGNNQESSSEAVTAWAALAAWAEVRADSTLVDTAEWMLSMEADAARRLWLAPDLSHAPEYEHDIVALQWGGKRDYATWFSADPAAMLGIELIPLGPTQRDALALGDDLTAEHIETTVAAATPDGFTVQFSDYLLMYLALAGPQDAEQAWHAAATLPDTSIDDGSSRAYLMAWTAQHAAAPA